MKRIAAFLLAGALPLCAAADLYVDCNDPNAADDAVEGRGSSVLPYRTIQAALDAAPPGGTIRVRPGIYDEGEQTSPMDASDCPSRLLITNRVTISSTDGAAVTEIRGSNGQSANRLGAGAVRGVLVTETGAGSVIEGFTIANSSTYSGGDNAGHARGGGVRCVADGYVVDCVFTNCFASLGGALCGGTAVRCFFKGNGGPVWKSATAAEANLWNSVVVHDYFHPSTSGSQKSLTAVTNVNCTVVNVNGNYADFYNCASYNLLSCAFAKAEDVSGTSANCVYRKDGKGVKHCTNPFRGDFRLLTASAAVNAGNAEYLESVIALPDSIARKDFTGNDLTGLTGTIHAGASQTTANPQHAGIELSDTSTYLHVDGVYLPPNGYMYAESWPVTWRIEPGAPDFWNVSSTFSTNVLSISRAYLNNGTEYSIAALYPLRDGTFRAVLPNNTTTYYFGQNKASEVLWADAANGNDETGDGSSASPFRSLQKAVTASAAAAGTGSTLVLARPGVYGAVDGTAADGVAARVAYSGGGSLTVRAVGGPDVTAIVGSADGSSDVRCVSGSFVVQGFTLRDGRTRGETDAAKEGAIAKSATLLDCVVSNCTAAGDACVGANGQRVRFDGNVSDGYLLSAGSKRVWAFCAFTRNVCAAGLVRGDSVETCFYNCTFRGNDTAGQPLLARLYGVPVNCIIDANGGALLSAQCEGYAGNVYWNAASTVDNAAYTRMDPLFPSDLADIRPSVDSPARGAGVFDSTLWYQKDVWMYCSADVYGAPVALEADGSMVAGAVQGGFLSGYVLSDPYGCLVIEGGSSGRHEYQEGTSVTLSVSAAPSAIRDVKGVIVTEAGAVTTNLFTDCADGVWTTTVGGTGETVTIVPFTSCDWYVDALNGSDDNDGFTLQTAKRTLAGISTNAALVAGDVVHVQPGTYDTGSVQASSASRTFVRVLVPDGVTLLADEGRDVTTIAGAASPDPAQSDGSGDGAVRAVQLGAGARVVGFTIAGGRSLHQSSSDAPEDAVAGVSGADETSEAVDCLFTDCRGYVCCGAVATFRRCRASSCGTVHASTPRPQFSGATLVDCLVSGSLSGKVVESCDVYGSTLVPASGWHCVTGDESCRVWNSVICGYARKGPDYRSCIFATNATYNTWNESAIHYSQESSVDCVFTSVAATGLSSGWKPLHADGLTVDAGNNALLAPSVSARPADLSGAPRVMNGSVDVGAYEWDVRPSVKRAAGRAFTSVEYVSSNVFATAGGILLDGASAELEACLRTTSQQVDFRLTVSGDAVLRVCVDGSPDAVFAAGTSFCTVDVPQSGKILFRIEGDGSAEIAKIDRSLRLIVR